MISGSHDSSRPYLSVGPKGKDRASIGLCHAGSHAGCFVLYYSQPSATPQWYLLEFAGPECMVEIQDSDYSFFAEDKSEMEEMLDSFKIVWFDGDKAKALMYAHFPGVGPGLLQRCLGWVRRWRARTWH